MSPLRVLYVASEASPLVKTGGLGDVAGALPPSLRAAGVDARLLLPAYPAVVAGARGLRRIARGIEPLAGAPRLDLLQGRMPDGETPLYAIDCPGLYARGGGPYVDASGAEWPDNALRFGMLSRVAAILAGPGTPLRWRPALLHCNDWQSGLAPAYVALDPANECRTLMTVHNVAFAGVFAPEIIPILGLPRAAFSMHGFEFHGSVSFLKAGVYYADHLSTVSPRYALEIQSESYGGGLHGLFAARRANLTGILNGIDDGAWNPATDVHLARRYHAGDLDGKRACKAALRDEVGLPRNLHAPLVGVVTRLTHQKGIDLVPAAFARLGGRSPDLVLLGTGDLPIEAALRRLERTRAGHVRIVTRYDETLAHRVYGGADIFLMPSRFEPCGLAQMLAMRYGTPPVARRTGGLADTVVHASRGALARGEATGFLFDDADPQAIAAVIAEALALRDDSEAWRALQRAGMQRDFGWAARAGEYRALYSRVAEQ